MAKSGPQAIAYKQLFRKEVIGRPTRLISFADASYANRNNGGSVESGIVLLARSICRDGAVKCVGHVISFYSHKIGRVCRSSLEAECIALANVLDVSIWLKAVIFEVYTGKFRRGGILEEDTLPSFSPFQIDGRKLPSSNEPSIDNDQWGSVGRRKRQILMNHPIGGDFDFKRML